MEGGGGGGRRRTSHQVSVVDKSNLRDLLRAREDDESNRDNLAGLTLGAIIGCDATRPDRGPPVTRTLFDIIREEESSNKNLTGVNRRNWKSFRDRLRLRRTSHDDNGDCVLQISDPISVTIAPESAQIGNGADNREDTLTEYEAAATANRPVMMRLAAALANERELQRRREIERERSNTVPEIEEMREEQQIVVGPAVQTAPAAAEEEEEEEEEAPVRTSLMALLEETDRQLSDTGMVGTTLIGDVADEENAGDDNDGGRGEYVCCVCMLRHKGSAFIPCGHTFCRLCSRELWVSRGNCPLCNGYILEILDIF